MILPISGETRGIFYHSGNSHCLQTLMILMDRCVVLYLYLLYLYSLYLYFLCFYFLISKTGSEVTCLEWSPAYEDFIAVGIGSFDILHTNMPGVSHWKDDVYIYICTLLKKFSSGQWTFFSQRGGLVFYTLKNPGWPEMNITLPSSPFCIKGVVILHFPFNPLLTAIRYITKFRCFSLIERHCYRKSKERLALYDHSFTLCLSFHSLHPHMLAVSWKQLKIKKVSKIVWPSRKIT